MSYSLTYPPQVLRDAGLRVVECRDWQTRGHGDVGETYGVILHHTAGSRVGNINLDILINGRPGLDGPLCNLGLGRDGTYYMVAAGKAWHAGNGSWKDCYDGNLNFVGIEAENTGLPNDSPWPPVQLDAYDRGVAALLTWAEVDENWCIGHKEWAPHRKPDPDFDMPGMRARVKALLDANKTTKLMRAGPPIVKPDYGELVVSAMRRFGYPVFTGKDELTLAYIEGVDIDGRRNANRPNAFDATRMLLVSDGAGKLSIAGAWYATTHAGAYYEHHRLNPDGAFHIALGSQAAWKRGIYHHGNYPALLEVLPLHGTRDDEEDFQRDPRFPVFENVGAHHHWGYDFPRDDVGKSSAGCQVGEYKDEHLEFIEWIDSDPREMAAPGQFLWTSAVLTADQVLSPPKLMAAAPISEERIVAGAAFVRNYADAAGYGGAVSDDVCRDLSQGVIEVDSNRGK